jgi:hypothetical protein
MKHLKEILAVLAIGALSGCQMNDVEHTTVPIIDPVFSTLVERDSIGVGAYLQIQVLDAAEIAYEKIQAFNQIKRFDHLNLVSSTVADVNALEGRLELYSYLVFDEWKGTDSGVQLTLEAGTVKSIYLNGGKQVKQWPEKGGLKYSIRPGDGMDLLYEKLRVISQEKAYRAKFQHISLRTKQVLTAFDLQMAHLPMWYFVNKTGDNTWELVEVYFENKHVKYFIVSKYRN